MFLTQQWFCDNVGQNLEMKCMGLRQLILVIQDEKDREQKEEQKEFC